MNTNEFKEKIKKGINAISKFMDTMYFAIVLVCIELFCYFLELDLITILTVSFFITFALLFKKNLNCLLVIFLTMGSIISLGKSPGNIPLKSLYYFQPSVYMTCIVAAGVPVIIATVKGIRNCVKQEFKSTPLLISIFVLCLTFLINGIFSDTYRPLDALFGVFMVFFFGILFLAIIPGMKINRNTLLGISRQIAIYAFVPIIELAVYYIKNFADGMSLDTRTMIFLGWGNRNTIGLVFLLCLCFIIALIKYEPNKGIRIGGCVVGVLTIVGIVFSFSRQAYVCGGVLAVAYLVYALFHSEGKKKICCIVSVGTITAGIVVTFIILFINGFFETITMDNLITFGDGRIYLWGKALEVFKDNPIFGGGFYYLGGDPKVQLDNIMPLCCHNTILQMMSACGLFGLLAYLGYRAVTIRIALKNFDSYKLYPILGVGVILITSLLDIHLFDLFGSSFYAILLAMAMSPKGEDSEKKDEPSIDNEKDSNEVCLCAD